MLEGVRCVLFLEVGLGIDGDWEGRRTRVREGGKRGPERVGMRKLEDWRKRGSRRRC